MFTTNDLELTRHIVAKVLREDDETIGRHVNIITTETENDTLEIFNFYVQFVGFKRYELTFACGDDVSEPIEYENLTEALLAVVSLYVRDLFTNAASDWAMAKQYEEDKERGLI